MISPGKPESFEASHPMKTNQQILNGKHGGVTKMKNVGYIGRWENNGIRMSLWG